MATLNGQQVDQLVEKLQSTFNLQDLTNLLLYELDRHLDRIVSPNFHLGTVMREVVEAGEREGWTIVFLQAVGKRRQGRPDVQMLIQQLLDHLGFVEAREIVGRVSSAGNIADIKKEVSDIENGEGSADIGPLLSDLRGLCNVRDWPHDMAFMRAFLGLILQLQSDVQKGITIKTAIDNALKRQGNYRNPAWDPSGMLVSRAPYFHGALKNLQREKTDVLPVDIVLLVMTKDEARELAEGEAFGACPSEVKSQAKMAFDELRALLENGGHADWADRYGQYRQDWRPFGTADTIDGIVGSVLFQAEPRYTRRLEANYIDLRSMDKRDPAYFVRLQHLRRQGCFVIVDVVSLRHPELHADFHTSLLDAFDSTWVVEIAPLEGAFEIQLKLMVAFERELDAEFRRRREFGEEQRCRTANRREDFTGWFGDRLNDMIPAELHREQQGIRGQMRWG